MLLDRRGTDNILKIHKPNHVVHKTSHVFRREIFILLSELQEYTLQIILISVPETTGALFRSSEREKQQNGAGAQREEKKEGKKGKKTKWTAMKKTKKR